MMDVVDRLVEVELQDEDDFLRVIETLTRIGVSSKREKKLFQSCHILHKKNKYYIVHFKELFLLDGKCQIFLTMIVLEEIRLLRYLMNGD